MSRVEFSFAYHAFFWFLSSPLQLMLLRLNYPALESFIESHFRIFNCYIIFREKLFNFDDFLTPPYLRRRVLCGFSLTHLQAQVNSIPLTLETFTIFSHSLTTFTAAATASLSYLQPTIILPTIAENNG